jgi:hypothetical protein
MSVTHIGVRTPSDRSQFHVVDSYGEHEDLSGMEYEVFEHKDDDSKECLIGTSHDAVGLVTWWRADTFEEAEAWVEQQKEDARDAAADASYSEVLAVFAGHKEEIADAVLTGLARVGALAGGWDAETVEVALRPVTDLLMRYNIPSVGDSGSDAIAFWEGVALKHGAT